jgi:hypothetical protein
MLRHAKQWFHQRVCHDRPQSCTHYHYSEFPLATFEAFMAAPSMGRYFNQNIEGSGADGPYDWRTHGFRNLITFALRTAKSSYSFEKATNLQGHIVDDEFERCLAYLHFEGSVMHLPVMIGADDHDVRRRQRPLLQR